jgi:uncharacterized membrane protein
MPKLIRLYIVSVAIGFALSAVFLVLLVWLDIAGLRHLVLETASGGIAAVMLFVMNGIVFAAVQFAIAIMRLADDDDEPRGGLRAPNVLRLAPIKVVAKPIAKPRSKSAK